MKSINFEFLQKNNADLVALGAFAEHYIYTDPASALVKLRQFIERMVDHIYTITQQEKPYQAHLIDLLTDATFKHHTPRVVLDKFHAIRIKGNKAAHGEKITQKTALWLLKESYDLACWYYLTYQTNNIKACGHYQQPPSVNLAGVTKAKLKREKKAALEKLAVQDRQLKTLLTRLERVEEQASSYKAQIETLQTLSLKAQHSADVLNFDEATTRKRLIDTQLADVGWDIGANGRNTDAVTQEEKVKYQPTRSKIGYADYVLWDDNGKPLAVIEAKKTAVSAEQGKTQAEYYADGLEKEHGQRPVIFYTNGYDIWLWDDVKTDGKRNYPPRKLFGFYSKDSLQYLIYQRSAKKALDTLSPSHEIAGRLYQIESIKRVTEQLTQKRRKSLIVQATGTGKTRVAIALTDLLIRASWVKRVLFLCDRRELRKQAKNAYNDFLNEPLTIVSKKTAQDRNQRIYLATYPAMIKIFQSFDVGFFDLIIADESHRSIYNVYGDLFHYFDSLHVGLTATPVEFVSRNTYQLFNCENQQPTAYYSFEQGVNEGYLTPYEVSTYTTDFLRQGIKYNQLTAEQKQEIEEKGEALQHLDYEAKQIDKQVYNKDTARHIINNLMDHGIRDASQQHVGKTIIFARNHNHAVLLQQVFDQLYPQYGGKFCQVIDHYDPRAEQLIDDFKQANHELTIAVSVDMLDTGIDVPEVVNLVFAKPIHSKVKFWQMIGRGTRLCADLFGIGKDKTVFHIFDHWGNFDYFEFDYQHKEPTIATSLTQRLFEARITLAESTLKAAEPKAFQRIAHLLEQAIHQLPEDSLRIKERWKSILHVRQPEVIQQWAAGTVATLRQDIAPLMQWITIRGYVEAYQLDLLITEMQNDLINNAASFDHRKITLLEKVNNLQMNLNIVREKAELIRTIRHKVYWTTLTSQTDKHTALEQLDDLRQELRQIIHCQQQQSHTKADIDVIDITEDSTGIQTGTRSSLLQSVDMKVYEKEAEAVLKSLFDSNPTLQKIRQGQAVNAQELETLSALVLTQNADVDLNTLKSFYEAATPLDHIIRTLIGMDANAVKARFEAFAQAYPSLNAKQLRFLGLLQNHIARYGLIEIDRLYQSPFINVHADSIDGIFTEKAADELIDIIFSFDPTHLHDKDITHV